MNAIFHRTSIRNYKDIPVEQDKITKILQAAMAAPSACNQQPWEYYVVTNRDKIVELSQTSPYATPAKEAPVVFVPCYRKTEGIIVPEYLQIDMSTSVENMLLEIDTLGLGAVWLGIAPELDRMEEVRKVLELPEELCAFALVPCGYPVKESVQENRYDESRVHYIN